MVASLICDKMKLGIDERKELSDDEVIRLIDVDHIVPLRCGGTNHHSNVDVISRAEHKTKTRTIDRRFLNAVRRVEKREAASENVAKLLKQPARERPKKKWPKRKMRR